MWIKHNDKLINADTLSTITQEKTKIYGHFLNGEMIILGEFWTEDEAKKVYKSIIRGCLSDTGIIIKDTRRGTVCLKKKKA